MGGCSNKGPLAEAVSLWPILPFLGFGFCAAWVALAMGTAWLSPGETSGVALTNLSWVMYFSMGAVLLLVRLVVCGRFPAVERALDGRVAAVAAGFCASAGSLLVILVGPGFFQAALGEGTYAVFQIGSALLGVGFGFLYLRLGIRYSALPLRRAIAYLCYAHLLAVFVYLAVRISPSWRVNEVGPPLVAVVAFIVLPLLASTTLCLESPSHVRSAVPQFPARHVVSPDMLSESMPDVPPTLHEARDEGGSASKIGGGALSARRLFRRAMACFAAVLFLFGLVQAAVTTDVTNTAPPSDTLNVSDLAILARVILLIAFCLLASTLEASRLNFSKLCVGIVAVLMLLVILALALDVAGATWVVVVKVTVFMFELLVWCLLFAVASCRPQQSMGINALLFGVCSLGNGIGMLAGARAPSLMGASAFYLICAVALLPAFLLLSERNINSLFWGGGVRPDTTLEVLLGRRLRADNGKAKGGFLLRLNEYAEQRGLSVRETETLRHLVAGRGDSQIAEAMGISYNTARTHVRNVYAKLGVHDRQTLIDSVNEQLRKR